MSGFPHPNFSAARFDRRIICNYPLIYHQVYYGTLCSKKDKGVIPMAEKKILILALFGDPTLPAGIPNTGGFNQTLRELLVSLAAWKHPICVITDISSYRTEPHCPISNYIELYRVYVSPEEHKNQELLQAAQERILTDIHKIVGPNMGNIALIHSFYWFSGHLAELLHERHQIPYIHTPISLAHYKIAAGSQANCLYQVECEPSFLRKADLVLAITEQEAEVLSSHYQVKKTRIVITGRSVDKVFHNPARDDNGCPRYVMPSSLERHILPADTPWWRFGAYIYLGRMVSIKGVRQIIQAWSLLYGQYGKETPPLWLAGGSPEQITELRGNLLTHVRELSEYETQGKVIWWGYLDQTAISTLLLKSLVLITHSRFEAGGRVILEAMCQGRPVIATPNGFAADYIRDWVNGFLVPYDDCIGLARRMEHFIRQPYLAYSMGHTAKVTFQHIEQSWNYSGTHRFIYEQYWNADKPSVTITKNQKISVRIPEEASERVDSFPYCDINFSDEEWNRELTAHLKGTPGRFCTISSTGSHARHYGVEIDGIPFRIKQFYNRLNRDALWNQDEPKVIGQIEQLQRAEICQHFRGILPFSAYSELGAYYILPQLQTIDTDYKTACQLLDTFHSNLLPDHHKPQSDAVQSPTHYMNELCTAIDALEKSALTLKSSVGKRLLHCLSSVRILEKQSRNDAQFGANYGKSPVGHVIVLEGNPLLLPASSWYWGEIGPDYVYAALDTGTPVRALPGQRSHVRQYLWYFVLVWKSILQTEWSSTFTTTIPTNILDEIMAQLGLSGNKIIF